MNKSLDLRLSMPRCGHCGRYWRPAQGVIARAAFCQRCSPERCNIAASTLEVRPIQRAELSGDYLLPRRLRGR